MPGYYVYLMSSLPMLHFGMKPPFDFEGFIEKCRTLIPEEDLKIIESSSIEGLYTYDTLNSTLKRWQDFDTALRNELVKIRAPRKKIDSEKYLRLGEDFNLQVVQIALHAHRIVSLLDSEKALDQARWIFLDELSAGHYFDIDLLIIYAHKLLILKRWEKISHADNNRLLQETLGVN